MPSAMLAPWSPSIAALAVQLLASGQVVSVPTETVYGLAARAWDSAAVTRIFAAKQRPSFDPLIAHVPPSWNSLDKLAQHEVIDLSSTSAAWRETVSRLMQEFWPGPLTILMPRHPRVSELVTSGLPHLAVRMPAHPVFCELLETLQAPLAAPSANRFGRISPTTAEHVASELGAAIPLIIDGGPARLGLESTILHCDEAGQVSCLRLGAYPLERFQSVLGMIPPRVSSTHPALAPGMLARHYAPESLLVLMADWEAASLEKLLQSYPGRDLALLQCGPEAPYSAAVKALLHVRRATVYVLSMQHDDEEAARRLFPLLREIDSQRHGLILAETPAAADGLWPAIRDRLQRAAIAAE